MEEGQRLSPLSIGSLSITEKEWELRLPVPTLCRVLQLCFITAQNQNEHEVRASKYFQGRHGPHGGWQWCMEMSLLIWGGGLVANGRQGAR